MGDANGSKLSKTPSGLKADSKRGHRETKSKRSRLKKPKSDGLGNDNEARRAGMSGKTRDTEKLSTTDNNYNRRTTTLEPGLYWDAENTLLEIKTDGATSWVEAKNRPGESEGDACPLGDERDWRRAVHQHRPASGSQVRVSDRRRRNHFEVRKS